MVNRIRAILARLHQAEAIEDMTSILIDCIRSEAIGKGSGA